MPHVPQVLLTNTEFGGNIRPSVQHDHRQPVLAGIACEDVATSRVATRGFEDDTETDLCEHQSRQKEDTASVPFPY